MKTTLTKIIFSLSFLMIMGFSFAQSPQAFNYQAVARDASGNLLVSQALGIRVSLHMGSATGGVVYSELFAPTTNEFGLFTLAIGTGTPIDGQFDTLAWGKNQYWMQVEMDPAGGVTYTDMGTSQFLSVPFAMYAENTGALPAGNDGQTLRYNGASWVAANNLINDGLNISIGVPSPAVKLHVGGTLRVDDDDPLIQFHTGTVQKGFIQSWGSKSDLLVANMASSGAVALWTNYTERMRVDSVGNVGVNCATPAYKFEVDGPTGTFNASGIRIQNTSASSGWSFYPAFSGAMIIGKTSNLGSFDGTTGAYSATSDERLKTDIRPLESVLPSILSMQLKRYEFINNNPTHKESIGIIAQDLQKLFPEFVSENTANDGNPLVENQLGVDYSGLSILAIKAIQEQQIEIEKLKAEIKALKETLDQLKK